MSAPTTPGRFPGGDGKHIDRGPWRGSDSGTHAPRVSVRVFRSARKNPSSRRRQTICLEQYLYGMITSGELNPAPGFTQEGPFPQEEIVREIPELTWPRQTP